MNKPFSFKNLTGTQVGKVSRKFIALVLAAAMVLATVVPYLANGGNGGIDDIDVTAAQTVSENETSSAATTDTAKTRDVYFVNRNSNTEKLELWNENETSDSASDDEKAIWVQQMAEPATDSMDYHFTGDDLTDKSYLTECEVKMSDTGAVDSMGAKIYKAEIPETWSYIAFSYFSTDETYGENTTFQNINGVNYPLSTPTNPRHRTMMIKIDEDNQYIVKTISEGKTAWEDAVTAGLTTSQGFYVDTTLYYADENAKENGYRKPVSETIDPSNRATQENAESKAESIAEETESSDTVEEKRSVANRQVRSLSVNRLPMKAPAVNNSYIYLDTSNLVADDVDWRGASTLYLYNLSKKAFHEATTGEQGIFAWNVSSSSDYSDTDTFIFTYTNEWKNIDYHNYKRTSDITDNISAAKGKIYKWDGTHTTDIKGTCFDQLTGTTYTSNYVPSVTDESLDKTTMKVGEVATLTFTLSKDATIAWNAASAGLEVTSDQNSLNSWKDASGSPTFTFAAGENKLYIRGTADAATGSSMTLKSLYGLTQIDSGVNLTVTSTASTTNGTFAPNPMTLDLAGSRVGHTVSGTLSLSLKSTFENTTVATTSIRWSSNNDNVTVSSAGENATSATVTATMPSDWTNESDTVTISALVTFADGSTKTYSYDQVTVKYGNVKTYRVYFWDKVKIDGTKWDTDDSIYLYLWSVKGTTETILDNGTTKLNVATDYVDTQNAGTLYYKEFSVDKDASAKIIFRTDDAWGEKKNQTVDLDAVDGTVYYLSNEQDSDGKQKVSTLIAGEGSIKRKQRTLSTTLTDVDNKEVTQLLVGQTATLTSIVKPALGTDEKATYSVKKASDGTDGTGIATVTDATSSAKSAFSTLKETLSNAVDNLLGIDAEASDTTATTTTTEDSSTLTKTVTGISKGTVNINVSVPQLTGVDLANPTATVSLEVVNALVTPENPQLTVNGTTTSDSKDLTLSIGSGVTYTSVVWTLDSNATDKGITLTKEDGQDDTKPLIETIAASQRDDLPSTATVTITIKNGDTVVDTLTVPVTILSGRYEEGYIYYDATLSRVDQQDVQDDSRYAAIPYFDYSNKSKKGDLWVRFYKADGTAITSYVNDSKYGTGKTFASCVQKEAKNSVYDIKISGTAASGSSAELASLSPGSVVIGDNSYNYTYKIPIPDGAVKVKFAQGQDNLADSNNNPKSTAKLDIPTAKGSCYYADSADPTVYANHKGVRGGYWSTVYTVRDPEDENSAKKSSNNNLTQIDNDDTSINGTTYDSKVDIWLKSTIYDYYSDVELNGLNRSTTLTSSDNNSSGSSWNYATFRQFDQALSDYYEGNAYSGRGSSTTNSVNWPLYTGHFQPNVDKWGNTFRENVANSLGLYGLKDSTVTGTGYTKFFSTNNSTIDSNGGGNDSNRKYDSAAQGLAGSTLSGGDRGTVTMPRDSSVTMPYFNESFLNGNNSKNMVLGKVYDDVSFPFTRYDRDGNGVYYYGFDSARTTVHMKSGYLTTTSQADYKINAEDNKQESDKSRGTNGDAWSKNTDATGTRGKDGVSNEYGYFPLNNTDVTGPSAMQYNYGFGTKLEIPFTLDSNGEVAVTNGDTTTYYPMVFTFSGDDDVWVYIDGKLVLDLGGDHGRVSGCINFANGRGRSANNGSYTYKYSTYDNGSTSYPSQAVNAGKVYVSKVKSSPSGVNTTNDDSKNTLTTLLGDKNIYDGGTHTLTMFYMERGQWESNMKVEFNFTPKTDLSVRKKFTNTGIDVTDSTTDGTVYAMVTRHTKAEETAATNAKAADGSQDTDVVILDSSASNVVGKYCKALTYSSDATNRWKATFPGLDQYANASDTTTKYVYHVWEVATNPDGTIKEEDGKPVKATLNSVVYVGTTPYTYSGYNAQGNTTTLTNSTTSGTSLTLTKMFPNTEQSDRPASIRVKVQRAEWDISDNEKYPGSTTGAEITLPSDANLGEWKTVTDILGENYNNGWIVLNPSDASSDNWTHTFNGLQISPDDNSSTGKFYVYRVIEATGTETNATEANEGDTVTYTNGRNENSYWVHYTGTNNDQSTWSYMAPGVTPIKKVTTTTENDQTTTTTTYSYKKSSAGTIIGGSVTMSNVLIVHLPSTGSKTGMYLTMLALLLMAGAGTFGLFGNKKRNIVA